MSELHRYMNGKALSVSVSYSPLHITHQFTSFLAPVESYIKACIDHEYMRLGLIPNIERKEYDGQISLVFSFSTGAEGVICGVANYLKDEYGHEAPNIVQGDFTRKAASRAPRMR